MIPKECGLSRYCVSEIITLIRITEYQDNDYRPDYFLSLCEKGRIHKNSPIVIEEQKLIVRTKIEHPNTFFGYSGETENHEQYINQYNTYQYGSSFLSGLSMINEFDYLWFLDTPRQTEPERVYIDCRYFDHEWMNLSITTRLELERWFPRLRKKT